jgi:hypothetical protein
MFVLFSNQHLISLTHAVDVTRYYSYLVSYKFIEKYSPTDVKTLHPVNSVKAHFLIILDNCMRVNTLTNKL